MTGLRQIDLGDGRVLDAFVAGLSHRLARYYAPQFEAQRKADAAGLDRALRHHAVSRGQPASPRHGRELGPRIAHPCGQSGPFLIRQVGAGFVHGAQHRVASLLALGQELEEAHRFQL